MPKQQQCTYQACRKPSCRSGRYCYRLLVRVFPG
jgi:hypothetical protein